MLCHYTTTVSYICKICKNISAKKGRLQLARYGQDIFERNPNLATPIFITKNFNPSSKIEMLLTGK